MKKIERLTDLEPDPHNANRGTERGRAALEESLRRYGAGRSIVVDRAGRIIAGNKTAEVAVELGLGARVVRTQGDELVVVVREDLDLESDPRARSLALADNRVAELDLDFDASVLLEARANGADVDLFWTAGELARLVKQEEKATDARDLIESLESVASPKAAAARVDGRTTYNTERILLPITVSTATARRWRKFKEQIGEADDSRAFSMLLDAAIDERGRARIPLGKESDD